MGAGSSRIDVNNPQYLVHLANDDSSVVRVAALHQMNQNIMMGRWMFKLRQWKDTRSHSLLQLSIVSP